MDWRDYISVDPNVCHGKPCVRGTRVMISVVLDNLAGGMAAEELAQHYPGVSPEAARACLAYASDVVKEGSVLLAA